MEQQVKLAAQECLNVWATACASASEDRPAVETSTIHLACSVLELSTDSDSADIHRTNNTYTSVKGTTYSLPAAYSALSVRSVKVLDVGSKSASSVHVGSSADDNAGAPLQGWLVLLLENDQWKCISAAFSRFRKFTSIRPEDFSAVTALTWDGYCGANRASDGVAMAKVFHETCRLTYAYNNVVQIKDQQVFCQKVTNRYSREEMHIPYAHLQNDLRAAQGDTLLSVDFATPDLAMVTLKVGHPPCLWTDILTCAKLNGQWWIVHKSSCSEPFLVDLKQKLSE
jgi:hypothetical protein